MLRREYALEKREKRMWEALEMNMKNQKPTSPLTNFVIVRKRITMQNLEDLRERKIKNRSSRNVTTDRAYFESLLQLINNPSNHTERLFSHMGWIDAEDAIHLWQKNTPRRPMTLHEFYVQYKTSLDRVLKTQEWDHMQGILAQLHKLQIRSKIAMFCILDALYPPEHGLTLERAVQVWNTAIERSTRYVIRGPSRLFEAMSFALHVVHDFMYNQSYYGKTLRVYSLDTRNFIVSLAVTHVCQCQCFALYPQAMAEQFGFTDYIHMVRAPGHVYTAVNEGGGSHDVLLIDGASPNYGLQVDNRSGIATELLASDISANLQPPRFMSEYSKSQALSSLNELLHFAVRKKNPMARVVRLQLLGKLFGMNVTPLIATAAAADVYWRYRLGLLKLDNGEEASHLDDLDPWTWTEKYGEDVNADADILEGLRSFDNVKMYAPVLSADRIQNRVVFSCLRRHYPFTTGAPESFVHYQTSAFRMVACYEVTDINNEWLKIALFKESTHTRRCLTDLRFRERHNHQKLPLRRVRDVRVFVDAANYGHIDDAEEQVSGLSHVLLSYYEAKQEGKVELLEAKAFFENEISELQKRNFTSTEKCVVRVGNQLVWGSVMPRSTLSYIRNHGHVFPSTGPFWFNPPKLTQYTRNDLVQLWSTFASTGIEVEAESDFRRRTEERDPSVIEQWVGAPLIFDTQHFSTSEALNIHLRTDRPVRFKLRRSGSTSMSFLSHFRTFHDPSFFYVSFEPFLQTFAL